MVRVVGRAQRGQSTFAAIDDCSPITIIFKRGFQRAVVIDSSTIVERAQ
jgi:hypothetical protein